MDSVGIEWSRNRNDGQRRDPTAAAQANERAEASGGKMTTTISTGRILG